MGLLDLLKSQPKWKHPDAAVRMSAVHEIPGDDQDVLVAVAREDEDRQVRLAAVTRLIRPGALADLARDDRDADVRREARERVLALARDEQDPSTADELLAAVRTLADAAALTTLARDAELEVIARGAFDRLRESGADAKTFSGLARKSSHLTIRLEALSDLQDESELASVALKTDFKETGLAALERVTNREQLEAVAARAKNKVVSRRARALLREQDERQQAEARSQAAEAEARRQHVAGLCRAADTLRSRVAVVTEPAEWSQIADELRELESEWQGLEVPPDTQMTSRFTSAVEAIKAASVEFEQRRVVEEQQAATRAEQAAWRRALLERLEGVPIPAADDEAAEHDVASAIASVTAEFEALGAARDPDNAAVAAVFRQIRERLLTTLERRQTARESRPQLEQILQQLDRLASADAMPEPADLVRLHKAWTRLSPDAELHADLVTRASETQQRVEARLTQVREAREKEDRANMARVAQLCARLEAAATAEGLALRQADRLARDARAAIEQPGTFSSKRDHDAAVERLKQAYALLAPRLKELREADEWQRWANASVQEELCRRAEALIDEPDPETAWRKSRDLFEDWKKVASAPRDRGQALWTRFKTAQDRVRAKCDAFFGQQAQERAGNAARKIALTERAEALAESTDWIKTADEIKGLQAEWKTIGPVPRGQEKAIWDRFRTACDRFFTRRHEDLITRKHAWSENLAKKEALCARAEALVESTAWDDAAAEIKRLQAEWKTIGPVRKNKSEAIWQRFRAAIDRFFERYQQRHRLEEAGKLADREALCAELEELGRTVVADPPVAREELLTKVRGVRNRWAQAPPVPGPDGVRLEDRYGAAFDAILTAGAELLTGTELDAQENQRKMEKLCTTVESLAQATTPGAGASPVSILAAQLREALAANTIGGRVSDEARWRASLDDVRNAQAAWRRIGIVPRAVERQLSNRFRKACNRFFDELRRKQATA